MNTVLGAFMQIEQLEGSCFVSVGGLVNSLFKFGIPGDRLNPLEEDDDDSNDEWMSFNVKREGAVPLTFASSSMSIHS